METPFVPRSLSRAAMRKTYYIVRYLDVNTGENFLFYSNILCLRPDQRNLLCKGCKKTAIGIITSLGMIGTLSSYYYRPWTELQDEAPEVRTRVLILAETYFLTISQNLLLVFPKGHFRPCWRGSCRGSGFARLLGLSCPSCRWDRPVFSTLTSSIGFLCLALLLNLTTKNRSCMDSSSVFLM